MAGFGLVYVADFQNSRVVEWPQTAKEGQVVAGGLGAGNGTGQLSLPSAVIYDEGTRSLIVCDYGNRRVVQVSLAYVGLITDVLIENIKCMGLAMDNEAFLYVSDGDRHEVRRYQMGNSNGTLVAGGNGAGNGLNQLNTPYGLAVDQQRSVYVADHKNHRVMKWKSGAKEGVIVAGGQGSGSDLSRVIYPTGIFVDTFDSLYVSDSGNNRVVRWRPSASQGTVIVGGNGGGEQPNQVYGPDGLSFDKDGNLYVACQWSDRVLRFNVLKV